METRLKILNYASKKGWLWLVKWSMSKKLAQSDLGYAMNLAVFHRHLRVMKYLVRNGVDVNVADDYGFTPLMRVAERSNLETAKFLVANGANVNAASNKGWTPLICAIRRGKGHLETVEFLLANGANVNAANDKGLTSLMQAAKFGLLEIVEFLVANGANVNAVDINGNTAFIYAAKNVVTMDDLKICSFFRDNGGDVNYQNNEGKSAGTYLLTCPLLKH